MHRLTPSLGILAFFALTACAVEDPLDVVAPGTSAQDDSDLYTWLVEEEVPARSSLTAVPDPATLAADATDPRYKVGVSVPLDAAVDLSGVSAAALGSAALEVSSGAIRRDGTGFVWSAIVHAPGAAAVRLEITDLSLPDDAQLYVYNDRGQVAGPYTGVGPLGTGELWTHTLRGDRVALQLRYDGADAQAALQSASLHLAGVGYLDDRFTPAFYGDGPADERAFCDFNNACVYNAECPGASQPAFIEDAQDAVALMVFLSGGSYYICSGGLVADTDSTSQIPYFLTANHCISRSSEAGSLEAYFQYVTSCGGSCAFPTRENPIGATILSTSSTSDYTLLRLNGAPPSGSYFLPYSSTPIASSNGDSLYRISHPGGAPQAYSTHRVDTSKGTCRTWPRGNWIYSTDTYGATEGGSSGSPVLNAAGELVGQLSGGCGTNIGDECDTVNNATVDGALAAYFGNVEQWLAPSGGGGDTGDTGTPPTCDLGQPGEACDAAADCCSGNCKGKPGRKTCK